MPRTTTRAYRARLATTASRLAGSAAALTRHAQEIEDDLGTCGTSMALRAAARHARTAHAHARTALDNIDAQIAQRDAARPPLP